MSPSPQLRPFVELSWQSASASPEGVERVLPTGAMHLVLRFADEPLRLLVRGGGVAVGHAIVGGARTSFYAKHTGGRTRTLGAMLKPGAARALFGVTASELAERHTPLELLWGREAHSFLDRVASALDPMAVFETELARRLANARPFDLPIDAMPVAELVRRSGYSHRVFTNKFRDEVGLAPKAFAKVQRLQRAIALVRTRRSLADVAFEAGYADQPHLCRDFAAMTGLSPAEYRRIAPAAANHVAAGVDFLQDGRRA